MIIDAHAHIYPQKIAEKATESIGNFYGISMCNSVGTSEKLIEQGNKIGVDRYVVHSVATKKEQVVSINDFIFDECKKHKEFLGFMTLHQDLTEEEVFSEVKRCKKLGFYGIKLHPDFQKFNVDDEVVKKFYRAAGEVNFPVLLHAGDNRYDYSKPFRISNVAKEFKDVNLIAAHFGGYRCWEQVDCYLGLSNVYFDTSSSLSFITPEFAKSLIYKFGVEKFFFGCDFPMWTHEDELNKLNALSLPSKDLEKILGLNVKNLLKL